MVELKDKYLAYLEKHRNDVVSYDALFVKPYQILRENYSDQDLRIDGVFFSGADIADKLISFLGEISPLSKVIDPCCGAGDLLLAYTRQLPKLEKPMETIGSWSEIIYGNDINADLVAVTNLRLVMNAFFECDKQYTIGECIDCWKKFSFPHLTTSNALNLDIKKHHIVLLNPPYQQEKISVKYSWGTGRISMAAVFLYELFKKNSQATFVAILPDVIRSGSRYQRLRTELFPFNWDLSTIYGRFDKQTDVDVFIVSNKTEQGNNINLAENKTSTISDHFDVHVGTIVPHRDPIIGETHLYLTAKNTPAGQELQKFEETLQAAKKAFKGPFVVVKRTSSPSDKCRCAATVVNCDKYFYIENHLIVLLPKDKRLETCQKVLCFLKSEKCNDIVNSVIRCRHLTVSAIKNLPYSQEKENE